MKRLSKIHLRMNKFLFMASVLFLCVGAAIPANGQTTNLTGTWNINQVTIKKTVNGVVSENTYSMGESFDIFADCPQRITFKAGNTVVFEYDDRASREAPYTVEGNIITRMAPQAFYRYKYTITGSNSIQLVYSINYSYNHPDGRTDRITEQSTFHGYRK